MMSKTNGKETNNESIDKEDLKKQIDQLKEMSSKVMKKLPLLGPVTWLYMNSNQHRHIFTSDLEWLVLPPLVLNQCKLYVKGDAPIAYASWALVTEEVFDRLKSGNSRLTPHEWKSGDIVWLVDVATPFGALNDVVKDLKENVFEGKQIFVAKKGDDGKPDAQVL